MEKLSYVLGMGKERSHRIQKKDNNHKRGIDKATLYLQKGNWKGLPQTKKEIVYQPKGSQEKKRLEKSSSKKNN